MFFFKLKYNAPVTLTFSLFSTLILVLSTSLWPDLLVNFFVLDGRGSFSFSSSHDIFTLFSYVFGHLSWSHLVSNLTILLLIGPILEEKYTSRTLLGMILITAVVNGLLNVLFFPSRLAGASGIVFMMILLISFTNIRHREIPVTFLLIISIYLTREILGTFQQDSVSQISHLMGGLCGSFFGFSYLHRQQRKRDRVRSRDSSNSPTFKSIID